jgi:hypothetical protein
MITRTCDGCSRVIALDDPHAARNVPIGMEAATADWCGSCIMIIRAELPRLAAQARAAERAAAAEPVRSRALNIWHGAGSRIRG